MKYILEIDEDVFRSNPGHPHECMAGLCHDVAGSMRMDCFLGWHMLCPFSGMKMACSDVKAAHWKALEAKEG